MLHMESVVTQWLCGYIEISRVVVRFAVTMVDGGNRKQGESL